MDRGGTARSVKVAQTEIWNTIKRRISNQTQLGFVHRVNLTQLSDALIK